MILLGLFFAFAIADARGGQAPPLLQAAPYLGNTPRARPISNSSVAIPGQYASQGEMRTLAISYRLATSGSDRCQDKVPITGMLLRHLGQYRRADRPGVEKQFGPGLGPMVAAIVPDSPAAAAGLAPGDIILTIEGQPVSPSPALDSDFDQRAAQAYSDNLDKRLATVSGTGEVRLSILRNGQAHTVAFRPVAGCRSLVHLARSAQRNAFADGKHVFITSAVADIALDDDQLAFILAHEMAHNILHHADRLRAARVGHGTFRALGASGRLVRETERQADLLGADLMLDAGFDPVGGGQSLNIIDREPFRIGLLDDHDSNADRVAAIRKHVAERRPAENVN